MDKIVPVVHCIDTEGPLYESLETKFERLETIFGISHLSPTAENFDKICRGELNLGGKEKLAQEVFSSHLSHFMGTWEAVEEMVRQAASPSFRSRIQDSFGNPYVYNWFCMDHAGYEVNPRRRDLGYLKVSDRYAGWLKEGLLAKDGFHWHFHPMSIYKEAHRCGTSLLNSPHIWEGLARRIIDRKWFPSCVRAGFQSERPDIHWFLEQYIPFDFSNTSVEDTASLEGQADLAQGRSGDWRRAPKDWDVYHPSHDDYQIPGNCRRWIARSLNALNRFANLDAFEVEKAFAQANEGKRTLLGIASHDFRDLSPEVDYVRELLQKVQKRYPDVKFKFCEALEAFRFVAYANELGTPLELELKLTRSNNGTPSFITIQTLQGEVFGPQPFLAIKTRSGCYIHDNLDFGLDGRSWRYVFDVETVLPDDLLVVGVGANDKFGNTSVKVICV